jgi:hypothetical protein
MMGQGLTARVRDAGAKGAISCMTPPLWHRVEDKQCVGSGGREFQRSSSGFVIRLVPFRRILFCPSEY